MRACKTILGLALSLTLGGCSAVVLHPSGDIAAQQRDLLLMATGLMLLIIVPVMALSIFFAWRYRASNPKARYEPDWHHSTQLELVIWGAPLLIIIALGALTWMGTHLLDPYRSLDRVSAGKPVARGLPPLEVEAVALDWKWLFIYPQYGVASLNELAAPVDRPITFHITSSSVMNSFFVPALAGQIYAMPGMETKLHAVINAPGEYRGFSANYSGAGFSKMHFKFKGLGDADFGTWVGRARASAEALTRAEYLVLERPSEDDKVRQFGSVEAGLYHAVLNLCAQTGKMCEDQMMAIDDKGGLGLAGVNNVLPLVYDKYARRGAVFGPERSYVAGICTPSDAAPQTPPQDKTWAAARPAALQISQLAPAPSPLLSRIQTHE